MTVPFSGSERLVDANGYPTDEFKIILAQLIKVSTDTAAVTAPTGGATVDTEARAAIAAIIAASS